MAHEVVAVSEQPPKTVEYLFQHDLAADQWKSVGKWASARTTEGDEFASAVAIGSDFLLVGASRHSGDGPGYVATFALPTTR